MFTLVSSLLPTARPWLLAGISFCLCALVDCIWYAGLPAQPADGVASLRAPSLALSVASLCVYTHWVQQLARQFAGRPHRHALLINMASISILSVTIAQWILFVSTPHSWTDMATQVQILLVVVPLAPIGPAYLLFRRTEAV